MIITTTPMIEGSPVREYKGIVTSEVIIGANAIVGVKVDYETVGESNSMLMVICCGTAVLV